MDYLVFDFSITPLEPYREILISDLADINFESFIETANGVEAFIQKDLYNQNSFCELAIIKKEGITYIKKTIKEQNWNSEWESNFNPIDVNGECYIRASFHQPVGTKYDIIIDPKMSFGTGHHATTYLMIAEILKMDLNHQNILDMGCGTGVLAILAEKKSAKKIIAIDTDEWAYQNAVENITINNAKNIEVLRGNSSLLKEYSFSTIFANINRNILLQDLNIYAKVLQENGDLLLSGFYTQDIPLMISEAKKYNLDLMTNSTKDNWSMLHLKKHRID